MGLDVSSGTVRAAPAGKGALSSFCRQGPCRRCSRGRFTWGIIPRGYRLLSVSCLSSLSTLSLSTLSTLSCLSCVFLGIDNTSIQPESG